MNFIPAPSVRSDTDELRAELLKLPPEGEQGLEGLVAHALSAFLGRQFRVARAGRQHGRDGATSPGSFDLFFEAKLYAGRAPGTETLQAKLLSAINDHQPYLDVWVVSCTTAIGENSVKELVATGERFGVTVVALDWSPHPLPPLASLLAAVRESVSDWLQRHTQPAHGAAIATALDAVGQSPSLPAALVELDQTLSPATAGWDAARVRNEAWLQTVFTDRQKARHVFGQFVAPEDPAFPVIARQRDVEKIVEATTQLDNSMLAVIGDEGTGKTWLCAMAWTHLKDRPVLLLCTTDNPLWEIALSDPLRFLALLLIEHTGGAQLNDAVDRWMRRLDNWGKRAPGEVRIWLVLDGMNERESRRWSELVDRLMELPSGLGIRLVLTSRPVFFRNRVLPQLTGYTIPQITVGVFTEQEVLKGLRHSGVDAALVNTAVREFLRNPRIFGIAVGMLDRLKPDELTRERILFEYWRKRFEERRDLHHNDSDMRRLLISHAETIRAALRQGASIAAASFRRDLWKEHSGPAHRITNPTIDDELTEVESGRFFEPDPDREGNYRVREEGLPYALALLAIDEIRAAPEAEMAARIESALDPIRGLDLMADVMLAALGVACIDPKCSEALAAAIFCSLLEIQNLSDASLETILAYVSARPGPFIAAAELQSKSPRHRHDRDEWVAWLLFQRREHDAVKVRLDIAIRRWLALWCLEPEQWPRHGLSGQELEKEQVKHEERRAKIASRLASLSPEEQRFLDRFCHKTDSPSLMGIDRLALQLIAGRPLVPFAEAIVAWHLCDSLTSRIFASQGVEAELSWLFRLNPVDFGAATKALYAALAHVESDTPSETGIWTAIGALRGTGLPTDAMKADALFEKLAPRAKFPGSRRIERFCDTDPIDPHSSDPTNLANAIERIVELDITGLRSSMSLTSEDHDLGDLTPALARFAPEVLVAKLRDFARDLKRRSGYGARFLAFRLPKLSALLSSIEVGTLREAYGEFVSRPETEADSEQHVAAQYALLALLPHLNAADQLDALLALPGDKGEMIQLRCLFKPLEPEELAGRLEQAEKANSSKALRRTLYFASTSRNLDERSRAIVERSFVHSNYVVRLLAFDTAAQCGDEDLLAGLAQSNWSGLTTNPESTESFYGSKALAEVPARFRGVNTLMRMSLGWQSAVIDTWGEDCIRAHAEIITQLIRDSLNLPEHATPEVPIVRRIEKAATTTGYAFIDTSPESEKKRDAHAALKELATDSDASWKAAQARKQSATTAYIRKLKEHRAGRLIDPVYIDSFEVIASRTPRAFQTIVALLFAVEGRQLRPLANIAACVAVVLSRTEPDRSAELFQRFANARPDVGLIVGAAELPFSSLALWLASDGARLRGLRTARLQAVRNDGEMFVEVLCAAAAGKTVELLAYAEKLMATEHPGQLARAITIAGFCDLNEVSPRILNDPRCRRGFLKVAAEIARASYERNAWARHWYAQACLAEDNVQFWRYCALMIRAADRRFALWFRPVRDLRLAALMPFVTAAREGLKQRGKKKQTDREKTLFGLAPPSEEILAAINDQDARERLRARGTPQSFAKV